MYDRYKEVLGIVRALAEHKEAAEHAENEHRYHSEEAKRLKKVIQTNRELANEAQIALDRWITVATCTPTGEFASALKSRLEGDKSEQM